MTNISWGASSTEISLLEANAKQQLKKGGNPMEFQMNATASESFNRSVDMCLSLPLCETFQL